MKFDVVVGNPPYQDENVGSNNQATPVYNYFYDLAETIANKYSLISPARFLSNQGATPKAWNKKMLSDNHLKIECFRMLTLRVELWFCIATITKILVQLKHSYLLMS